MSKTRQSEQTAQEGLAGVPNDESEADDDPGAESGETVCDSGTFPMAATDPASATIEIIEGGLQLLLTRFSDEFADVILDLDDTGPDSVTYIGAIAPQDAIEGIDLVFTMIFDSPTGATDTTRPPVQDAATQTTTTVP
ncbi:hypothetical protein ACFLQ7_04310 [Actinomycetota bacterium]